MRSGLGLIPDRTMYEQTTIDPCAVVAEKRTHSKTGTVGRRIMVVESLGDEQEPTLTLFAVFENSNDVEDGTTTADESWTRVACAERCTARAVTCRDRAKRASTAAHTSGETDRQFELRWAERWATLARAYRS